MDPESASLSIIIASKKIVSILNASGEKLHRGYCNVILEALKLFKNRHNEYSTYVRSMGSTENGIFSIIIQLKIFFILLQVSSESG